MMTWRTRRNKGSKERGAVSGEFAPSPNAEGGEHRLASASPSFPASRSPLLAPCLLLFALLLGLLLIAAPATASTVPSVAINANVAVPDFPQGVSFSLSATADAEIQRVELLYTTANRETLNLVTPDFTPGATVEVSHDLDLQINYQPPGLDIEYFWRLTDANGDIIETEPSTFLWEDSRFDWESISTDQVTVFAYNGDEEFNQAVLDSAQRTIDRLQTDFDVERSRPIRIWVYDNREDFSGAQAPNSEPWIAGTAYPQLSLILAVLPVGNLNEVDRVVPHEVSHQVLHQATRNPFSWPPTWLDEGLAVYYQDAGTESHPQVVQGAVDDGRLYSIRALNSSFPYDTGDATLAYAQSLSIVTFIIDEFGEDGMGDLIAVFQEGVSPDEAVERALGVSLDELDRVWKESLGYDGDRAPSGAVRDASGNRPPPPSAGQISPGEVAMGFASLLAIVVGVIAFARSRRTQHDDDGEDAFLDGHRSLNHRPDSDRQAWSDFPHPDTSN